MTTTEHHRTSLTSHLLAEISSPKELPCLSLYQPTHRRHPENQQDPIRFRNLLKQLETSLRQRYPAADAETLLEPFEALGRDADFWNHAQDGLAVLGGPGFFRAVRLPEPVNELVVVADSFHTKPLRRLLQSADRYQVLGLSLDAVRLFEGNRHGLDEVDLGPSVPRTIAAALSALGREASEAHQTVASYGGVGSGSAPMRHGDGGKNDAADADADRYFRAVDRAVLEEHSRRSGLPLILAALPEHHHRFHQISQNPHLVAEGIRVDPDSVSAEELCALAWPAVEPQYQGRLTKLLAEFEQARSNGLGSDDLAQIAQAASIGRVGTLLIEAERQIAGRLDRATGRVEAAGDGDPKGEDLLDDVGELAAAKGGRVIVIPGEQMTTRTGIAATYRY